MDGEGVYEVYVTGDDGSLGCLSDADAASHSLGCRDTSSARGGVGKGRMWEKTGRSGSRMMMQARSHISDSRDAASLRRQWLGEVKQRSAAVSYAPVIQ